MKWFEAMKETHSSKELLEIIRISNMSEEDKDKWLLEICSQQIFKKPLKKQ